MSGKNLIVKECAFCEDVFYAERNSATYCSDSCKEKFYLRKKTTPQWYDHDPNEGKKLPPGTVTSWEMPEDKLVFYGDLYSLYRKLAEFLSPKQLEEEKAFILNSQPYSKTSDWSESATQIFTDEYFMEVFRIFPDRYKLYVWPWGEDNEKPFV